MDYRDLNTFGVGQRVDISGVAEMQNLKIERISDTGVSVTGGQLTPFTVISGRSPARIHEETVAVMTVDGATTHNDIVVERAARGSYTEKMKHIQIPEGSFTIKQLAELNGIPQPYAYNWVKDNCAEDGFAERAEGQRGKSAALYKKI